MARAYDDPVLAHRYEIAILGVGTILVAMFFIEHALFSRLVGMTGGLMVVPLLAERLNALWTDSR